MDACRKHPRPTVDEIRRRLDCDFTTGELTWRHCDGMTKTWLARYAGKRAGTIKRTKSGYVYRRIKIGTSEFPASQVVWLLFHGAWPESSLDHRDCDSLNDSLTNLRPATAAQQAANRRIRSDNPTGVKGVFFLKDRGKYQAEIYSGGERLYLGRFDTLDEAAAIRSKAAREFHGEFARDG